MPSKVQVYAYDLTHGMAAALSPMLLGQQVQGIWHTAVVIDGTEEIFFGYGISRTRAGTTMFGKPHHIIDIGTTEVPKEMRDELLSDISSRYRPEDYSLLWHNCNHFSNEFAQLLTGEGLPDYILNQAESVFNTPWGESLMPLIMQMEGFTGRATANGLAQPAVASDQQPAAQQQAAAVIAGPSRPACAAAQPVATASSPSASGAAEPGSRSAANAASAAANAAMEREAQQAAAAAAEDSKHSVGAATAGAAAGSSPGVAAAASSSHAVEEVTHAANQAASAAHKVTDGVAGLNITADSRMQVDETR